MDANGNIIPLVDGDQGEGIMDMLEDYCEESKMDTPKPNRERSTQRERTIFNKGKIH